MARVAFLHKLPMSFVVVGRGFTGNGHGERRIIPYQLTSDRKGERPMNVGLFESRDAAEDMCNRKGWSMEIVDLDASVEIRAVPGGKVKAKSEIKIGWVCHHIDCDCVCTKRPYMVHVNDKARKLKNGTVKLPAAWQAIKDALPQEASGFVCSCCKHMDREHTITLDAK